MVSSFVSVCSFITNGQSSITVHCRSQHIVVFKYCIKIFMLHITEYSTYKLLSIIQCKTYTTRSNRLTTLLRYMKKVKLHKILHICYTRLKKKSNKHFTGVCLKPTFHYAENSFPKSLPLFASTILLVNYGFLLLSDVAFPQANQMARKGRCERNIPPNGNQA